MQFPKTLSSVVLALLLFSWAVWAQEKAEREVEIHKNVKLVQLSNASNLPEDLVKQYSAFLPLLEDALRSSTTDQPDECSLTLRVSAGMREVGSAKTKRPLARVTAFRRNSKQEYEASIILYSYETAGPLNKDEIIQRLKKQVLEPAECHKAAE
jgi:hypothetical protein